jgi:hypothetical protein
MTTSRLPLELIDVLRTRLLQSTKGISEAYYLK